MGFARNLFFLCVCVWPSRHYISTRNEIYFHKEICFTNPLAPPRQNHSWGKFYQLRRLLTDFFLTTSIILFLTWSLSFLVWTTAPVGVSSCAGDFRRSCYMGPNLPSWLISCSHKFDWIKRIEISLIATINRLNGTVLRFSYRFWRR